MMKLSGALGLFPPSTKLLPRIEVCFKCHSARVIPSSYTVVRQLNRRTFKDVENYDKRTAKIPDSRNKLLLVIPVVTFGLGVWQIKRKIWKQNLNATLNERVNRDPVPLPENIDELNDMEFCPVRVKGRFCHDQELHLGMRSNLVGGTKNNQSGLFSSPKSGYLIVTPFELSDRDMTILVNRGWVPAGLLDQNKRLAGQVSGEVELIGLVRNSEKRKVLGIENQPEANKWIYRDINEMAKTVNAAPVFLDAIASTTVPGGPVGGQTKISLRDEHVSYIITWFALSFITAMLWYKKRPRSLASV